MSASNTNQTEDFAVRALELLEQSYAYYMQPLRSVPHSKDCENY
ncbi:hypothetical protein [Shimia sp.]